MFGKEFFANLGGLLILAALVRYAIPILQGKTHPVFASWAIWSGLDALTAIGKYHDGTLNPQIATAAFGCGCITVLALWHGKPGWSTVDKICFALGLLAIIGWYFSGNPTTAVTMSLIATMIACWSTYVSGIEDPSREDKLAWVIVTVSSACATLGVPHWTYAEMSQPLVFLGTQLVMVWILFVHPRLSRAHA